ncbi:sporulation protein YunB [Desulfocucumis palustris]|uniref:sporulation protein YunB n=1 Tax=Desulfocucumis palustris TaxID=1898651 RepID=UPI000CEA29C8|nr:sporulation protein YunB [Desulfocucumis palustris]
MFKRSNPYKRMAMVMLLVAIPLALLWYADFVMRPALFEMARVRAVKIATEAIHRAVIKKVADSGVHYNDLINIHKDSRGKVVLMQADTIRLNQLSSGVTLTVQDELNKIRSEDIRIPIGQLSGIYALANLGPGIRISIMPVGTVKVDLNDKFETAGINQTRHSIYLRFETEVRVIIPLKSGESKVVTEVPVTESIIVGDVPGTYVSLPWGVLGGGVN